MSLSILIVKTSSLGDIIQSFPVLHFLHQIFPQVAIDWVVEEKFASIVASHPLVRHAIIMDREKMAKFIFTLRKSSYDFLFDLQGNSKSGLITFVAKAKLKIGFGFASVREWPNVFATHFRFHVPTHINIRLQYLSLISQFYQLPIPSHRTTLLLKMTEEEAEGLTKIIPHNLQRAVMVCPGSQWINKQLSFETLIPFLNFVQKKLDCFFLLMWGNEKEKLLCEKIQQALIPLVTLVLDKLPLPVWQNLMSQMDLLIAVDSSALHLCATTSVPSFTVFGPTSAEIFKPMDKQHFAFQGKCPYGKIFEKRCPILRTCPTGACMKNLCPNELFQAFSSWWDKENFRGEI